MNEWWSGVGGRTRVVVIGGGRSCEHEVSLATASAVARSLDRERYDVVEQTIGADGRWRGDDGQFLAGGIAEAMAIIAGADVVFPAVHGPRGEDGTLAALCELAGVAYVGSGVRAGAAAMDKWITKLIAGELGIGTAPGVLMSSSSDAGLSAGMDLPLVVKPVSGGSSHGVSRVDRTDELAGAVASALAIDDRVLVERLMPGREIDIAVLERPDGSRLVGPPLEVVITAGAIFDTARKYDGRADFRVPAEVTELEHAAIADAAVALFDALGCAGVARFDFFVADGAVVLNEVNTMPGLTEQSQVPKMFSAIGITYGQLLTFLVEAARARPHHT